MPADPKRVQALFLLAVEQPDAVARAELLDRECGPDAELRARIEALLCAHDLPGSFLLPPAPSELEHFGTATFLAGKPDTATLPTASSSEADIDRPTHIPPAVTSTYEPDADRTSGILTGPFSPDPATLGVESTPTVGPTTNSVAGRVIADRYVLVDVIGEGGMGTVYRAEQTKPVKRQVAVKLIKAGMDSQAVLARFDAERQALALMDHPNIARVYDGGTTDSGQPFFVMELVTGVPITQYCDNARLPVRARLELFVSVCNAVQHAHQKGIIHRDLKPGNVLVTEVDGRPTPKVIDFGVAKATEQRLTDQSLADTGAIVGTPMYMSPEQADPTTFDIDTRTDVYALGVILYELLVGSTPIDAKQFRRGAVLEMLRIVREVDPPRPSTKLSTSDALPSIAANRNIEPAQLKRALRGDLDWIVMKSLEKDRTRRYDTANGFAADIQRHLAYEPVLAAPPSRAYRMRKFVRKNRGMVVAASLVMLVLLGGIAGTTWGMIRADRALTAEADRVMERDDAIGKRDVALGNAEAALARESQRVNERDTAVGKRDEAIKHANERADELKYQLGVSNMVLATAAYDNSDMKLATERLDKVPPEQRGWEWQYLKRQTRGGVFTLYGHTGGVNSLSFSPDGTRIVSGSDDESARVWDTRTGTSLLELRGHTSGVWSVSFSPDGTRIVGTSWDKTVRGWDARTGTPLFELKGDSDRPYQVSFSPDSTRIVTGGGAFGKPGEAKVWDARTGKHLLELKGHSGKVNSISFSPDGTRIVTAGGDFWGPGEAKVWDAQTGRELFDLKGHVGGVRSASFSPDGSRIVTGGGTLDKLGEAKVWDAWTGDLLFDLKGSLFVVSHLSFSPDGTQIVGESNGRVQIWNAQTGIILFELEEQSTPSFSPDGKRIITASHVGVAKVWDSRTGKALLDLKGHTDAGGDSIVNDVKYSPDGTRIITAGADGTVKVWDAWTGTSPTELKGHVGGVLSASFNPDDSQIITSSGNGTVKLWDARTGASLLELEGNTGQVGCVAFSPDGTRVVTGITTADHKSAEPSDPCEAKVWDARTGSPLVELKRNTGGKVLSVAFSPDGTRIVTGCIDKPVVWDAQSGRAIAELTGGTNYVTCLSFSPDNSKIISGDQSNSAIVWDARLGIRLFDLHGHGFLVKGASFSPDGTRIVTGSADKTARVWDARTGTSLLELKGHMQAVRSVSYSPDGTRIVTGSDDKTARVWDARTGTPLFELKGQMSHVMSVSFSTDGTRIVTGSDDGSARVWDTRTGHLIELNGHTDKVFQVSISQDSTRIVTASWDAATIVWDTHTGTRLLELQTKAGGARSVGFSPDGTKIVTGSWDGKAKIWDARTGTQLFELNGHKDWVVASFSQDGTQVVTQSVNNEAKVWNSRTGQELNGKPIPQTLPPPTVSPNGQFIAHIVHNRIELIPLVQTYNEISNRLLHSRPNSWRYREGYNAARQANNRFAARFYLDRLLSMPTQRTTARFQERNDFQADPLVIARTGFHYPALAKTPYDRGTVHMLALMGDRLAMRLVAQELMREGKPGPAVPMLFACLVTRPVTNPPAPPVEELLLAQAYLALNQPDEAKRFHRVAAEWLDRPIQPVRAVNFVSHSVFTPWLGLVGAVAPVEDVRRNPFDWESWHECDVFRAELEKALAAR